MAGLWADPFDEFPDTAHMLNGVYANVGSACSLSTANPCTGTQCLQIQTDNRIDSTGGINAVTSFRRVFGAPKVVAGVGFHFFCPQLPNTEVIIGVHNLGFRIAAFLSASGLGQVSLVLGTDGGIVAYSGGNFSSLDNTMTLLGRGDPCITVNAWNHFEARVTAGAAGSIEVRVNGVTVLNIASANTDPVGTGEVSQLWVGIPLGLSLPLMGAVWVDDLHAWDALGANPVDFVGNASVVYRAPIADTAIADWISVPGLPAYPYMSDNNDGTYIAAGSPGEKTAFTFAALPAEVQGVVYQQLSWRGLKTDAGDCNVAPCFISGSAETDLAAQPMTTAETWRWGIEAEDPATSGAPWTPTSANAFEGGVLRTL